MPPHTCRLRLRCPRPPPSPPFALVARPRVPVIPARRPHFVLITSHRQSGRARLSALPRDNAAQLLIALPISARARSRSTSPAAGLQTNACPIINCHDPLIGWGYASLRRPRTFLAYFFRARKDTRLFTTDLFPIFDALVRRNFTREFRSIDRIIAFSPPSFETDSSFARFSLPILPPPTLFTLRQYLLFHGNLS